jgi:hypothetical protein
MRKFSKTDNNPAAKAAKLDLRKRVLSEVRPASVLDLFCGTGEMYAGAWRNAESYAGCDERTWQVTDPPRFVADNLRLMRCLDLQSFNVFDFDAYGSPWSQIAILAALRRWGPGERGAIVLTDGSSLKLRWGAVPRSMATMAGLSGIQGVPSMSGVHELMGLALFGFVKRAKVNPVRMWQAEGRGRAQVVYLAMVFEGVEA